MRPLLPKNLFFFSFSFSSSSFPVSSTSARALLLQISHFSTYSNYPSHSPSYSRRHDEESRNMRVSVWWDFEYCNLPVGVNVFRLSQTITEAVRLNGIKGPIQITAFGDVSQLSKANQEALYSTGINLTHIPDGRKNSANRFLLVDDLWYWASQNPPPAHLFFISGDKDFAGILHRLRMNNYNILLATPGKAPDVLCSAATIIWQWTSLLKGENLIRKHFNHPPDGPFGSWYGPCKVPPENLFSVSEHSTSLQNVEVLEPNSDLKSGAVPKSVVRHVRHILKSHPKGLSITDLRAELTKCDVHLEKDYYGYKRFSRFLLSMPSIQLQSQGEGVFIVRLIPSESPEPSKSSVVPKLNGEGKSSFPPSAERHAGQPPNELQKSSLGSQKVVSLANTQLSENQFPQKEHELPKNKEDSSTTRCRKLSGNEILSSEDISHKIDEKDTPSKSHSAEQVYTKVENNGIANDKSENLKGEGKYEKPIRKEVHEVSHSRHSSPVDDSAVDKNPGGSIESYSKSPTFFSWIRSWWPFRKSSGKSDDFPVHQEKVVSPSEEPKLSKLYQAVSHSGKPELFSSDSFWSDMESFVFTPKGSLLFSQSRSREEITSKLQKDGPLVLRSLSESDILQLVDLLITEKKCLEESPSQSLPFGLARPVQNSSLLGQSHSANGLRSLFLSKTSQPSLQSSEQDVEKQNQSIPHAGTSPPPSKGKYTERSRSDILVDCQKLVNEILREHPEGYNIGSFRKLFVQRYGYHLDIHKLGYQKLASLLQIMPGVKLESTYIFPSVHPVCASDRETSVLKAQITNASHAVSNSDSELSDSAPKEDNIDSPWEELGPVSVSNSNQSDWESNLRQQIKELDLSTHLDYELIDSDDDSSECEGDSSVLAEPERQGKPQCNEKESHFRQALDSWHNNKEGENSIKKSDNVKVSGNSLADILNPSTESTQGTCSTVYREKPKPQKSYSFVADPVLPKKDKLIDGILDGLKNAEEAKMQN